MKAAETKPATTSAKSNEPFFRKESRQNFFNDNAAKSSFFSKRAGNSFIQPKLTIGQPNDKYEQEADAMADKVVQRLSGPETIRTKPIVSTITPIIQTKCAECEQEEKLQKKDEEDKDLLKDEKLQRKPIFESNAEPPDEENAVQRKCAECEKEEKLQKKGYGSSEIAASPSIESSLNTAKGSGSPLSTGTRREMEGSFGSDFSRVRIHNDSASAQMSKDLNAQAFTHGSDVYFNSGKYDANSIGGKHLLAHELTHVLQQFKEVGNSPIYKEKDNFIKGEHTFFPVSKIKRPDIQKQETDSSIGEEEETEESESAAETKGDSNYIPVCNQNGVNAWIPDPIRPNVQLFGLTSITINSSNVPQFNVESVGNSRVKVKKTDIVVPLINIQFLSNGVYTDDTPSVYHTLPGSSALPKKYPVIWEVDDTGKNKILQGELEHCNDYRLSFFWVAYSILKSVNQLANSGMTFTNKAAAEKELAKLVKLKPADWQNYLECVLKKASNSRDKNGIHIPKPAVIAVEKKNGKDYVRTKINLPGLSSSTDSYSLILSVMPSCSKNFQLLP